MAVNTVNAAIRYIRALIAGPLAEGQSDQYLLEQFVSKRDESAFAALLRRHGHMVLGVCMRVLHDEHLAEDALQATFLVLALKASKLRAPASLAGWLCGVALRLARKVKAQDLRSRRQVAREKPEPPLALPTEASRREEEALLDEELERLPDKYRLPLLMCYFEGCTQEEAAAQLGWTPGQVKGLLDRGRERLRFRLIRRGVTLSAAGLAIALSETARAATALSPRLAAPTVQAAMNLVSGKTLAECGVSASVATLAKGGMSIYPIKMLLVLTTLVVGVGATIWAANSGADPQRRGPEQQVVGQQQGEQGDFDGQGDDKAEKPKEDKTKEELKALAGKWICQSSEVDGVKRDAKESKDQSMSFDGEKCVQDDAATGDNFPGTHQLDLSGKQKVMTMKLTVGMKEVTLRYIFQRDGDTLKLCGHLLPGGELPTEFSAPGGSKRVFMVFNRADDKVEKQKEELKALAGKWVCESSEVNGTKRGAKDSKDQSMTFDGEKCVQKDAATGDNFPGTYQLDLSGEQKVMTMNLTIGMKEVTLRYIFQRDGDTLKLCGHLLPGGELPTEFSAPEGSRRVFMVFKREMK